MTSEVQVRVTPPPPPLQGSSLFPSLHPSLNLSPFSYQGRMWIAAWRLVFPTLPPPPSLSARSIYIHYLPLPNLLVILVTFPFIPPPPYDRDSREVFRRASETPLDRSN